MDVHISVWKCGNRENNLAFVDKKKGAKKRRRNKQSIEAVSGPQRNQRRRNVLEESRMYRGLQELVVWKRWWAAFDFDVGN